MKVGEKIQRIRKERGYTADQLAEMLGISAVSLRKYEYGERTPKDPMIAEIARCLEVNPSSLKSDWGSDANDAIHVLFELEEAFCLEPIRVGDTVRLGSSGRLWQRGPGSTGEGASPTGIGTTGT